MKSPLDRALDYTAAKVHLYRRSADETKNVRSMREFFHLGSCWQSIGDDLARQVFPEDTSEAEELQRVEMYVMRRFRELQSQQADELLVEMWSDFLGELSCWRVELAAPERKNDAQVEAQKLAREWVGTYWTHRKGGHYLVAAIAVDEATLDLRVEYISLEKGSRWSRTVAAWSEEVEGQPRFWRVDPPARAQEAGLVPRPEPERGSAG